MKVAKRYYLYYSPFTGQCHYDTKNRWRNATVGYLWECTLGDLIQNLKVLRPTVVAKLRYWELDDVSRLQEIARNIQQSK